MSVWSSLGWYLGFSTVWLAFCWLIFSPLGGIFVLLPALAGLCVGWFMTVFPAVTKRG